MQSEELIVTIRCITYNHNSFIRDCLEGFVMQKTNFRFEAIIHDDASFDGTADIIRDYANRYPNIIKPILESENQFTKGGYRLISNIMLERFPHGKYIAECEGDDYWTDPMKLQKQVDYLESHPEISASAHQCTIVGDGSGLFRENVPEIIDLKDLISNSRLFHTSSFIYRREQIMKLPSMTMPYTSGDKLLFLQTAIYGPIRYFDMPMAVYRKHGTGISSVVKLNDLKKDINIVRYMKSIFPQFPRFRYLSFLYGTFAMYPKDISKAEKIWYLFISFVLSFSFFPENIKILFNKIVTTKRFLSGK